MEFQGAAAIEQEVEQRQLIQMILVGAAAVCLVAALVTALAGRASSRVL